MKIQVCGLCLSGSRIRSLPTALFPSSSPQDLGTCCPFCLGECNPSLTGTPPQHTHFCMAFLTFCKQKATASVTFPFAYSLPSTVLRNTHLVPSQKFLPGIHRCYIPFTPQHQPPLFPVPPHTDPLPNFPSHFPLECPFSVSHLGIYMYISINQQTLQKT